MAEPSRWIAIVDDDPAVLKGLVRLLRGRALHPKTYGSAQEFLAALPDGPPECLIVDLQMPEMTGLELQQHLARIGIRIPTIIITAHGDIELRKRCESAGAIAEKERAFESFDVPKGTLRGSPPNPAEDLTTLRVSFYLVARKTLDNDLITDFTEDLMKARRDLLGELPILAQATAPSTEQNRASAISQIGSAPDRPRSEITAAGSLAGAGPARAAAVSGRMRARQAGSWERNANTSAN